MQTRPMKSFPVRAVIGFLALQMGFTTPSFASPMPISFLAIPTDSPEWIQLFFSDAAAQQLYTFLNFQSEIACQQDTYQNITCTAWLNREGDLRNAPPSPSLSMNLEDSYQGWISITPSQLEPTSLLEVSLQGGAVSKFLATSSGHDLNCVNDVCRFTVDTRGAIDPLN